MKTFKCRCVPVLWLALLSLCALASAQITFSRDWSGGKRAALPRDVALDCAQFTRLCRHFVHELKAAVSAELAAGAGKRRPAEDGPPVYDDDK